MSSRQSIEREGFEKPSCESCGFSFIICSRGALGEYPARLLIDYADVEDSGLGLG